MKKIMALLLGLLLTVSSAMAELMYILPDSNFRELTWAEVAEWDYETLGYAFNEIFARHGYVFIPGRKYEYYFSCQPWYTPNADSNNDRAVYPYVNEVEWKNYHLIKAVRAYKYNWGDWGKSMWDYFSTGFDTLMGFDYVQLRTGQNLPVYSAPSRNAWRGANGKASVGTGGAIYTAGWEGNWLLVMYETNNGSVRVGYVCAEDIRGGVPVDVSLSFDYIPATVNRRVTLTDDPARTNTTITTLYTGSTVTYLTSFFNRYAWDYVETTVGGQTVRGFLPAGNLTIEGEEEDAMAAYAADEYGWLDDDEYDWLNDDGEYDWLNDDGEYDWLNDDGEYDWLNDDEEYDWLNDDWEYDDDGSDEEEEYDYDWLK